MFAPCQLVGCVKGGSHGPWCRPLSRGAACRSSRRSRSCVAVAVALAPRLALCRARRCSSDDLPLPHTPSALCLGCAGPRARGPPVADVTLGRSPAGAPHPRPPGAPHLTRRAAATVPSAFLWVPRRCLPCRPPSRASCLKMARSAGPTYLCVREGSLLEGSVGLSVAMQALRVNSNARTASASAPPRLCARAASPPVPAASLQRARVCASSPAEVGGVLKTCTGLVVGRLLSWPGIVPERGPSNFSECRPHVAAVDAESHRVCPICFRIRVTFDHPVQVVFGRLRSMCWPECAPIPSSFGPKSNNRA